MFKKKRYEIKQLCSNCSQECIFNIPYGMSLRDYINHEQLVCDKCGCYPLKWEDNSRPVLSIAEEPEPKPSKKRTPKLPKPTLIPPTADKPAVTVTFIPEDMKAEEWK